MLHLLDGISHNIVFKTGLFVVC